MGFQSECPNQLIKIEMDMAFHFSDLHSRCSLLHHLSTNFADTRSLREICIAKYVFKYLFNIFSPYFVLNEFCCGRLRRVFCFIYLAIYLLSALHLTQINGRAKSSGFLFGLCFTNAICVRFRTWLISSRCLLVIAAHRAHRAHLNSLINNYSSPGSRAIKCWIKAALVKRSQTLNGFFEIHELHIRE